jgi:hypothetical protein
MSLIVVIIRYTFMYYILCLHMLNLENNNSIVVIIRYIFVYCACTCSIQESSDPSAFHHRKLG